MQREWGMWRFKIGVRRVLRVRVGIVLEGNDLGGVVGGEIGCF